MRSGWCSRKGALHAEPNRSGAERAYRAAPARDAHAPMAKTAGATRRPAPTWARDFAAAAHLTPPETKHKYRGRCSSEVHDTVFSAVIALLEPVVKRELAYYADETTWDEYPESDVPLRLLGDEVLMEATWAVVGDDSLASVLALVERRLDTAFDTPGRPASRQRAGWRRGRAGKRPRTRRAPMAAERGERARSSGWSRQPPDARAGVARPGS